MSETRLEQHYRRLLALFPDRQATLTLGTIADQLCCTKRHMRGLLLRMQQAGWLSWQPGVGRGHQSVLLLHYSEQQLLLKKAEQLLDDGKLGQAVSLLGHQQPLVTRMLRQRLGYRVNGDSQSLRIPYYRTMPNLCPGTPLRRSELHLVRQIFSGLTTIRSHDATVGPDLAHTWSHQEYLNWRFHLRPGVRFHDGSELTSHDVVASLRRMAMQPLFSHVQEITARGGLTVDIALSQPDPHLPLLLADTAALILPADFYTRPKFSSHPVGSGPYLVEQNNALHLRMQVFDNYYGLRGLLDEIEVIVWPASSAGEKRAELESQPSAWLSSSLSDIEYTAGQTSDETGQDDGEMFPEKGGYFLLCDQRSPYWQSLAARRWLRSILSPYAMLQCLTEPVRPLWIPAGSLMPEWLHGIPEGAVSRPPTLVPDVAVLRLAIYRQHPEFTMLVAAMQTLLAQQSVQLVCIELDYEAWANGEAEADLWLGTVNFPAPETWNVGAWLLSMPLLRRSISGGELSQLERWQHGFRAGTLTGKPLAGQVIAQGWLQPLFHHWMRLKSPGQAHGIKLNNLGWFDFTQAWMAPASGLDKVL